MFSRGEGAAFSKGTAPRWHSPICNLSPPRPTTRPISVYVYHSATREGAAVPQHLLNCRGSTCLTTHPSDLRHSNLIRGFISQLRDCLLYTSDAADERS